VNEVLRRLYEWYRSAPESEVYKGWDKEGWIDARRGSRARELLSGLVDLDGSVESVDAALQRLCSAPINGCLGFGSPEIQIKVARRKAGSQQLLVRFDMVTGGRTKRQVSRGILPPSNTQFDLFGEREEPREPASDDQDDPNKQTLLLDSEGSEHNKQTLLLDSDPNKQTLLLDSEGSEHNKQTLLLDSEAAKEAPTTRSVPRSDAYVGVDASEWHSADELDNLTIEADSFASGTVEEAPVGGDEEAGWADWKVDASTWAKLPEEERQLILESDDWRYEDLAEALGET